MQLMLVVLYRGLVLIGFMLYSNGGGTVVLLLLFILISFVSYAGDSLVLFFTFIMGLLVVMV